MSLAFQERNMAVLMKELLCCEEKMDYTGLMDVAEKYI